MIELLTNCSVTSDYRNAADDYMAERASKVFNVLPSIVSMDVGNATALKEEAEGRGDVPGDYSAGLGVPKSD